jgi:hypothetical protein
MLSNPGTVSFILYGTFILIAIIGLFLAIYAIRKGTIPPEKLEKIVDLSKYTIVSIAIATIALIITDLFKERQQDVKELEYFDKYVQDVKKVDGIWERFQLAKYLSIVAPSGDLKKSWKEYHDTLRIEYEEYLRLKKEMEKLDTISNPTQEQINKKEKINEVLEQKEAPLVSSYNIVKPRVYIQISEESQRQIAKTLQATLLNENFIAPGVENVGRKGNMYIPSQTEVRYYREDELPDAQRLISIIKSQNTGLPINEVPQKVPGTGRGTRPGHYEIWFSKANK